MLQKLAKVLAAPKGSKAAKPGGKRHAEPGGEKRRQAAGEPGQKPAKKIKKARRLLLTR